MYKFFVAPEQIGSSEVIITGKDVNHIKNVLRMKPGEHFYVSTGDDREYECELTTFTEEAVTAAIVDVYGSNRELPAKITLYQCLPKGDKMEWIIQKAVELGVYEIVPVVSSRVVTKLDAKKREKKCNRWNLIAESAAKQSKRNRIPKVREVMRFQEAVDESEALERVILPYENASGMDGARALIDQIKTAKSIGIFIGSEGGFSEEEVAYALAHSVDTMTLGHRILRTETAGMAVLSILMFAMDSDNTPVEKER